ncbi:MAG TPA: hypothetical protein VF441_02085, partial [Acidimicrobiia bacterium]
VLGCALALVPVFSTQGATVATYPSNDFDRGIAAWLRPRLQDHDDVVASTFRFEAAVTARLRGAATVVDVPFNTSRSAPKLDGSVLVDWAGGEYRWVPARAFAVLLRRSDWLVLTGRHRFNAAALVSWLRLNGAKVGIHADQTYNRSFSGAWARIYSIKHARVGEVPTIVTAAAAARMLQRHRFVVRRPTVIVGSPQELARLAGKLPLRPDITMLAAPPGYRT